MSLVISQLCKCYSTSSGSIEALRDINLHAEPGEFICVVGASGSGKSTLLRLIAGLEMPTSGELDLNGRAIVGPGADRGMVFQSYTLYPWMTLQKNVEFGLRLQGVNSKERRDRASYYLDIVGLASFARAYPKELSGGMKQRVAIARALATQPEVLLMDEPFGALDVQTREMMQEFLLEVWRRTNCTILTITHDVREAVFLAQRIYVLSAHPGTIDCEFQIDLPRDRTVLIEREPQFQSYVAAIQDRLRGLSKTTETSPMPTTSKAKADAH
ncbi:MAG: ABC transporter ATP-binding protein [Geitlerinemataceae cyanobacterium]